MIQILHSLNSNAHYIFAIAAIILPLVAIVAGTTTRKRALCGTIASITAFFALYFGSAALHEQLDLIRWQIGPRQLPESFVSELQNQPRGHAQIYYVPQGSDAFMFAQKLDIALYRAHWIMEPILQVPDKLPDLPYRVPVQVPPVILLGGQPSGVAIVINKMPDMKQPNPFNALMNALGSTLHILYAGTDETLPEGMLRIVVGSHP